MTVVLLAAGFAAVLGGALLFTNAVEWEEIVSGLGVGAVGTVLAAVSTALPESIIPVVAILRGEPDADEVAVGAIVHAHDDREGTDGHRRGRPFGCRGSLLRSSASGSRSSRPSSPSS